MSFKESLQVKGLRELTFHSLAIPSAAILLVVALFIVYLAKPPKKLNLPVVGVPGQKYYGDEIREGVSRYPNTPFVVPLNPPLVVLPMSTLDEVRNLPENKVSFKKLLAKQFLTKQTGIGNDKPETIIAIKLDLTRHIASTLNGLQDEIRYSLNKELGPCENWTPFVLYGLMARVVALLSGRVFVGRPLSRNEEWIDASINYTMDCMNARNSIAEWPTWLRSTVAPFLPAVKGVKQYGARGAKLLDPILKATLARAHDEKRSLDDDDEQGTFISWFLQHTKEKERENPVILAEAQMTLSFAAIHTTTMATSQIIFDLVVRPEYIQLLRDEIQQVIDEDGHDIDGEGFLKLKKASMPKLKKLDSFMKESQRTSPPGAVSHSRVTMAPLTLSTGHTLPANTRIGYPLIAVHTSLSTLTFSPAYNPPDALPPSQFDGFRFYKLRQMEGKESRHQFATTSPESLSFGHGNHACPGRFFASNEIKVVMIELLRNWEFRLKGDLEGKGGVEKRPKNHETELLLTPNTIAEIEFRRRKM